jgi:hypothetical protein
MYVIGKPIHFNIMVMEICEWLLRFKLRWLKLVKITLMGNDGSRVIEVERVEEQLAQCQLIERKSNRCPTQSAPSTAACTTSPMVECSSSSARASRRALRTQCRCTT